MNLALLGLLVFLLSVTGSNQQQIIGSIWNSQDNSTAADTLQWPPLQRRVRRTAAVWGAPVPDYSNIQLSDTITYIYTILFVDSKTTEHYANDMERVSVEILKLVRESNKYFYQLNIRVIVVDVVPTRRSDLTLYSFETYHNMQTALLPYHNIAVLVTYRYAGGLAFVSGMCSSKAVMLVGFYPHNPHAMASIFFHEVTHLIGVSHSHANESLDVPNCACNTMSFVPKASGAQMASQVAAESLIPTSARPVEGCLKIPGFDHNCTAQLAANLLYRSRCLPNTHRSKALNRAEGYTIESKIDPSLLSICGNGVLEAGESCDCGLSSFCKEWNCEPMICERKVPIWILILSGVALTLVAMGTLVLYGRSRSPSSSPFNKKYSAVIGEKMSTNVTSRQNHTIIEQICRQLLNLFQNFKALLCRKTQPTTSHANIHLPTATTTKLDPNSIIIVRSAQQLPAAGRPKIERPRIAPPPAPPIATLRPKNPPPPRPPPPLKAYSQLDQNITYKFEDFDESEDEGR